MFNPIQLIYPSIHVLITVGDHDLAFPRGGPRKTVPRARKRLLGGRDPGLLMKETDAVAEGTLSGRKKRAQSDPQNAMRSR